MTTKKDMSLEDVIDENTRLKKSILKFGICLKLFENNCDNEYLYNTFKELLESHNINLL